MNPRRRKRLLAVLIVFAMGFLAGLWSPISADPIKIIYSSLGGSQTSLWVTKEAGFFAKHGIDATLIFVSGSTVAASSLMAGEVQVAFIGGTAPVLSRLRGSDLVVIGGTTTTAILSLMTRKDVRSVADLKGRALGVVRYGSLGDIATQIVLQRHGLEPQRDVKILQMGEIGQILAAMKTGSISGGVLTPPITLEAKKLGFSELLDAKQVGMRFAEDAIVVSDGYLKNNKDRLQRFMRAYVEGIHFYKTNKEASLAVVKKYSRTSSPEILEETYQLYALEYLPKAPYPTQEGIRTILDLMSASEPKAKSANPAEFIYPDFVKTLDQSGFIGDLYKK